MAATSTRDTLQRVATHVLARARHQAVGRFGLVATPGGFGTPAFGPDHTVVRVDAGRLVVETAGRTATVRPIDGSTLRQLAEAAGADLDVAFEAGHDTPPVGDVDAPLAVDADAAVAIGDWYAYGWRVLGEVIAGVDGASRIQLWPEHFDAGVDVPVGAGENDRCNLGASPGDGYSEQPYLYVGPWTAERPGDECFWTAPFGAVLTCDDLTGAPDRVAAGVEFLRRGVGFLTSGG